MGIIGSQIQVCWAILALNLQVGITCARDPLVRIAILDSILQEGNDAGLGSGLGLRDAQCQDLV